MIDRLFEEFELPEFKASEYPSLDLAYIGDCVYELAIRTVLLSEGPKHVDSLNKRASRLAKAVTQSKIVLSIQDILTEEEMTIYKRARNTKVNSSAKNASISDYHRATGFEALIGYLYLNKRYDRMYELIHKGWDAIKEDR